MAVSSYKNPSRATWAQSAKRLGETFDKWGLGWEDWTIECDVEPNKRNGRWFGKSGAVTVRYRLPGRQGAVVMTLDSQNCPATNLSSIAITVEAIRMQERRGLGGLVQAHYLALAAPITARDPFEVLGLRPDATTDDVRAMYRSRANRAHPDGGGSEEAMKELNEARDAALERLTT